MSERGKWGNFCAVALLLTVLLVNPLWAATYYVSTFGNDSNDGSQGTPWATLQKAANSVQAGDLVLVADGTYIGANISVSGTSSSPITFRANGSNVLVNARNSSTPDNFNVEGADYVVIDGFKVEDAPRAGIRVAVSTGVVVQNNIIQRCQTWAIFTAYTPSIQILDNVCATATDEHGIYVSNSNVANDNPVISGNECFGNGHNGIQLNGDCFASGDGTISGAVLEGNIVHDNGWKGLSLISVNDSFIQNNIIYANGAAGVGAGGIHLTDEPSCNQPSTNNVVANNTVIEFQIAAVRMSDGATANVLFNNIVVANSIGDTFVQESSGNNIDTITNLTNTLTAGYFVDSAGRDYHLVPTSPALNAGTTTYGGKNAPTQDIDGDPRPNPNGGTVDAGAYEYSAAPPPPPPPPPPGGILPNHPRLFLTGNRLSELRTAACYDDAGNVIPGCTPTSQWLTLVDMVDVLNRGNGFDLALAYKITQNTSYRDRAISKVESMIAGGPQALVDQNYRFLYARDFLRNAACVYDWLYDELSASQRTSYVNYMLMILYISWNDDAVSDAIYNPGGWGTENPGNNFYYNFMLATAYAAIAAYDENPGTFTYGSSTYTFKLPFDGTDYTDILAYFYARMDQQAIPDWLNDEGKGGGWHEGNQYGPSSTRHMFEALLAVRDAGGKDYFNDASTNFPAESVLYHIYSTQPGGKVLYNGGDAGREETMAVYDYDRHAMLAAVNGLAGKPESEYGQWWLNHWKTGMSLKEVLRAMDFMLYRPTGIERPLSDLPLAYFAEGMDWMNSRSGWDDNAVSVSFVSTDQVAGHQHNDQNSFQIYRGTSGSGIGGWLVTDAQPFSQGLRRGTDHHNTILVGNASCQRTGRGTGSARFEFEATENYTYSLGDAADAYYDDQQVWCRSSDGTKQLNIFLREIVHIRPDYVIVFDRVTPINSNDVVTSYFHYHNQPIITGDLIEAENGDGKVFHKVLWPAPANMTKIDEQIGDSKRHETWRVEVVDPTPQANVQHMHSFYITSQGTTIMPDMVKIDSEANKMIGARIEDPAKDIYLFFSRDPGGATPAGNVTYEVGLENSSQHFLFNLLPFTEYSVDVAVNYGVYRITVGEGKGQKTSGQGVLQFELPSAPRTAQR